MSGKSSPPTTASPNEDDDRSSPVRVAAASILASAAKQVEDTTTTTTTGLVVVGGANNDPNDGPGEGAVVTQEASTTNTNNNDNSNDNAVVGASSSPTITPKEAEETSANPSIMNDGRTLLTLNETVTHERRWDIMFERLKQYKEQHGNCLVPNRYSKDTQLGSWVSAQRRQYKIVTSGGNESAAMTPDRAKKLRDIGFEWSTTNPRNVPWETRYDELCNFVSNYGHAEVPMRWEENPQLSNWVSKQRHQYKLMQSNRPSRLTPERVEKLTRVGFVWEASRRRIDQSDDDDDGVDPGTSGGGNSSSKGGNSGRKRMSSSKGSRSGGGGGRNRKKTMNSNNVLPTFTEGKPGRFGVDQPAPMGTVLPTPPFFAVGGDASNNGVLPAFASPQQQALAAQAQQFQLWAAMAGQAAAAANGTALSQPTPAFAAAAAGAAAMSPQFFMQMGSMPTTAIPFSNAAAGGMPGMPFAAPPGQQQQQGAMQNPGVSGTSNTAQPNPPSQDIPEPSAPPQQALPQGQPEQSSDNKPEGEERGDCAPKEDGESGTQGNDQQMVQNDEA